MIPLLGRSIGFCFAMASVWCWFVAVFSCIRYVKGRKPGVPLFPWPWEVGFVGYIDNDLTTEGIEARNKSFRYIFYFLGCLLIACVIFTATGPF